MHDLTTGLSNFVHVLDRTRVTLEPKIREYVRPGSIIITDCHAGYNNLNNIGYEHFTVNHSRNFVDPRTGVTTNHIESMWQKLKQSHKQRFGTHRSMLNSHLASFLRKQRFGKSLKEMIEHIKEINNQIF
jgi:transposase-like protein